MMFAVDQGATITVNGGETWSSWYNQPTAQFYHVITDDQFPYWVYGGQQESGSAGVASRGGYGSNRARDWRTVGVEEYGYAAPDPLDPNIIYGGKLSRFDKRTRPCAEHHARSRSDRANIGFCERHRSFFRQSINGSLFFAGNVLFKTMNGGQSWTVISPDLRAKNGTFPRMSASIAPKKWKRCRGAA